MKKILPRSFYSRETVQVARDLLGKLIVREINGTRMSGIIVETEAYRSDDPASHAFRGKRVGNAALFGPVGHAYVYFIYGNHFCLNFVAREAKEAAGGVLIRAIKPVEGIEYMEFNRGIHKPRHLADGPGKLSKALLITKREYGLDVTKKGSLYVTEGVAIHQSDIQATPRIGISKAQDLLWRFTIQL